MKQSIAGVGRKKEPAWSKSKHIKDVLSFGEVSFIDKVRVNDDVILGVAIATRTTWRRDEAYTRHRILT